MSTTPKFCVFLDDSRQCPVSGHTAAADGLDSRAVRLAAVIYGTISYALFLAVFVYLIGFVVDAAVPRSIDRAIDAPLWQALIADLGLLAAFGLQHSVMARPGFKRWWTRYVPAAVERSTYMLCTSAVLVLVFWQWRAIDINIWHVDPAPARVAIAALGGVGWGIVLASTFMIDHFDLFGLRQTLNVWRSKAHADSGFREVLLYRVVRHPLLLGFLIAFWAAPTMTAGRLTFALAMTAYILIAVRFEERDLVDALGEPYLRYRERVPMLLPRISR